MRYMYIICLCVSFCTSAFAADPVVIREARDTVLACGTGGLEVALADWHLSAGGAIVEDPDGGDIILVSDLTLLETIAAFEASLGQGCGATQTVTVAFTAVDTDGESASLGSVTFGTVDQTNPVVTTLPEFVTYKCQPGIQDTLVRWVQTRGGAEATDACSEVVWTTFIWNDSEGNSGTGTIDNGPYPTIVGACEYFINMSFLVLDDCQNQRAATGRFSLEDDTAPVIENVPANITVSCDNIPSTDAVTVSDYCDADVTLEVVEENTQTGTEGDCSFFNYDILRYYSATDACGNTARDTAVITVADLGPPIISGADTVIVACVDFEAGETVLIAAVDDCSETTIAIEDSEYIPACNTTVERIYTITDVCGNSVTFDQHVVIVDITGPEFTSPPLDLVLDCSTDEDVEAAFVSWVTDQLAIPVTDACSGVSAFAAVPGSYDIDDASTWPGTPVGGLSEQACPSQLVGTVRSETVDFVTFDDCGNAAVSTATFSIADTLVPVITGCIDDIQVTVGADQCTADVTIPPVAVVEDCSGIEDVILALSPTQLYELDPDVGLIVPALDVGSYAASLLVRDCAGNETLCSFQVAVLDDTAPILSGCPSDDTIALTGNICLVQYNLPSTDVGVTDNCSLNSIYNRKLPASTANELLSYSISGSDTTLNNKTYTFSETTPLRYNTGDVTLTVQAATPSSASGQVYTIFGEEGYEIGTIPSSPACERKTLTYALPSTVFNEWASDREVTISFISETTVSPCQGILSNGTDAVARLSARLSYSDAVVNYSVSGSTNIGSSTLTDTSSTTLRVGPNKITYFVSDLSGNMDSCSYDVIVTDDNAPIVRCKNAVLNIPPDGEQTVTLDPMLVDDGSEDECGDVTFEVRPSTFDCSQLGSELDVMLIVTDFSGNKDSCSAMVKVEPFDLVPSYSAGICQDDTLKLFANAPTPTTVGSYTYSWQGPNFTSSEDSPFILNATEANNGLYTVTVTGFGGCSTTGSVQVNVAPLTTPDITIAADTICEGIELLLTTTSFTGSITYEWYEQVGSENTLVGSTAAPSLVLTPAAGDHFYNVIANSENCISNRSASVSVHVVAIPEATVNNNFINICEEGSFTLGTTSFGAGYTYRWTGPDGYSSDKPFPETITNATFADAGEYNLVTSVSGCQSDTAVTRVNVFDKPATPVITAGETFCEGSTVSLTVNNIANADLYTWYLDGELFTSDTDNSLVITNAQASISGSWQVTVRDGICTSDTSEIANIIIEDLQDISVTNNGPGCQGDTLQLFVTFVAGANYQWSGPNGFTSSVQNPRIQAVAGEYTVEIVTGTNCETSGSTTVEVSSAPVITALSNNSTPCMDGETNIVFFPTIVPAMGNYTYSWEGPGGFASSELNPTLVNPTAADNGVYSLTVISGQCSSAPRTSEVDITITPDQPIITASDNNCEGQEIVLMITAVPDGSYQWTTPSGTTQTDDPRLTIANASINDQGEYVVTVQVGDCVSTPSEPYDLTLTSQPAAPTFTTNSPVCDGETLMLSVAGGNATDTYEWTGPQGTIVGEGRVLEIENASTEDAGSYQVQVIRGSCSSVPSDAAEVVIIEPVLTPVPEQMSYDICEGLTDEIVICVSESTRLQDATYTLVSINTGAILGEGAIPCFTISDLSTFEVGSNFLYLETQLGDCRSERSASFIVEVSSPPSFAATIVTDMTIICGGQDLELAAQHGPPLVEVEWSSTDEEIIFSESDLKTTTVSNLMDGENTIVLTYSQGACRDYSSDMVAITVVEEPQVEDDQYVLADRSAVQLTILDNDEVGDNFTLEIVTEPFVGMSEIEDDAITYTPDDKVSGSVTLVYEVCSVVCPDDCAQATVTIEVGDDSDCLAPTIITPNGDDINDNFVVPCLDGGSYPDSRLTVYNQWGDEVYGADDYDNSWAGTYEGKALAAGTYFYILDLGDGSEPLHSFLIVQK